jgi:hypothetical protein
MFDMYDVVIQEGEVADAFYIIDEGEVLITVHNRAVRTLKAGTYETTKKKKKKNTHTHTHTHTASFVACAPRFMYAKTEHSKQDWPVGTNL